MECLPLDPAHGVKDDVAAWRTVPRGWRDIDRIGPDTLARRLVEARAWAGLSTTTRILAAARPAAEVCYPPVASSAVEPRVSGLALDKFMQPFGQRATAGLCPAGRMATSRRSLETSVPTTTGVHCVPPLHNRARWAA
jgi:hypothetical protein